MAFGLGMFEIIILGVVGLLLLGGLIILIALLSGRNK